MPVHYSRGVAIPYGRQTIEEDDIQAVVDVMRGDWLTQGPTVAAFERDFAERCDARHAVAFSSGTAALHGAVFAAGGARGGEILTSAITFAASANCGVYLGMTPRFADIEPATWNVSARTVGAALSERTAVVVPVHFTGLPAPVAEIRKAVGGDVRIVEDAAHALGAATADEAVGSCRYADMAVFSLHPVKAITSGEGGMVTTRDARLAETLQLFRNHGLTRDRTRLRRRDGGWHQEQQLLGVNYRLTDIQSALGRSQLRKLDAFIERRNGIARRYRELLADVDGLELPPGASGGARHAYHLFVVRHRAGADARRRLYDGLRERGILAQVHYPPVYRHPYYEERYGFREGECPEAERFYAECVSLPCFPTLTEDEQVTVVDAVRELVGA